MSAVGIIGDDGSGVLYPYSVPTRHRMDAIRGKGSVRKGFQAGNDPHHILAVLAILADIRLAS